MIRVVVTGGRSYASQRAVYAALDVLHYCRPIGKLAHGDSFGADRLAEGWALDRGVEVVAFTAAWKVLGKAAGPTRNRAMLEAVTPDLVLAFPGGKGTANCVAIARELGIEVLVVEEPTRKET